MKTDALLKRVSALLPEGESALAATKAMPRGSAHETVLGIAGGVAGGTVAGGLAGVGMVAGSQSGSGRGDAGRAEREEAGVDVGKASQVLLVVTSEAVVLFTLSALGRPKEIVARLERSRITSVAAGQTKLFGQKMMEVVITTDTEAEVGFGVAKVYRSRGEAVIAALN